MTTIRIEDIEITGIDRATISSGLPHASSPKASEDRLVSLGGCKAGSGHDVALTGIVVYHTITADHSFWMQWQRYHFHQIISSTSKMHSLSTMELEFHHSTNIFAVVHANEMVELYRQELCSFEELIMSMPLGLMLKSDTVTNYLQLKTIWHQRHTHKMSSWKHYCEWIERLPLMDRILK